VAKTATGGTASAGSRLAATDMRTLPALVRTLMASRCSTGRDGAQLEGQGAQLEGQGAQLAGQGAQLEGKVLNSRGKALNSQGKVLNSRARTDSAQPPDGAAGRDADSADSCGQLKKRRLSAATNDATACRTDICVHEVGDADSADSCVPPYS
jgi:hypothetical protein